MAAKPTPATTPVVLGQNNYGKSGVRLVKVARDASTGVHTLRELEVAIALEGDFEAVHCRADNANCLPTDTMKNTVYALAKDHPLDSIESFALYLARHFVLTTPPVTSARVTITEVPWDRAGVDGRHHTHCFTRGSEERQLCTITHSPTTNRVSAGLSGLVILKTTDSAFSGYLKDKFTTLPETQDRIMATSVTATWEYPDAQTINYATARASIRTALLDTFAHHKSQSVQHTLFAMGKAALDSCPAINSIRLSLPNKHCLLVNLTPFGLENNNEIFVPTDEPYGLIEATVLRG